jgi:hypothetical protein
MLTIVTANITSMTGNGPETLVGCQLILPRAEANQTGPTGRSSQNPDFEGRICEYFLNDRSATF